jgi:hypothetical protein
MIFSENRFTLFRIMLWQSASQQRTAQQKRRGGMAPVAPQLLNSLVQG